MRRGRRPKNSRFLPNIDVDQWLANHPDFLIDCPNQPGNLRITREACAKRYTTANEPRWANIGAEPFHIFVFKMNLVPCRKCSMGASLAQEAKSKAA
ncbi:MAG: hypothetical protein AB1814_19095 [Thermodesulfobacteriota bacterium]